MFGQRHGGGDQALERGEGAAVQLLGRERGGEAAGVGDQPAHQLLAERVVGGGGEEVVMAEPGGDAGADDVGAVGEGVVGRGRDPVGDQRAGAQAGRIGAEGAQITQPGEAVRRGAQQVGSRGIAPAAGTKHADGAAQFHLALDQAGAAAGIARPGIADGKRRGVRHAGHPQAGQARHGAPGVAQPAAGIVAAHAPAVFPAGATRRLLMAAA